MTTTGHSDDYQRHESRSSSAFICRECGEILVDPPTLPVECECGGTFRRREEAGTEGDG